MFRLLVQVNGCSKWVSGLSSKLKTAAKTIVSRRFVIHPNYYRLLRCFVILIEDCGQNYSKQMFRLLVQVNGCSKWVSGLSSKLKTAAKTIVSRCFVIHPLLANNWNLTTNITNYASAHENRMMFCVRSHAIVKRCCQLPYRCLWKNTPPDKNILWKKAFRTPNQGLESSFCCWSAGQSLAQKEHVFHKHQ